jgi:Fur family ferric uptake transcriptional regulator
MAQVELVDRAAHYLLDRGLRITKARRLVIRSLVDYPGPHSAADLNVAMRRRVPLSSIYRTLLLLEEAGLLTKYRDGKGVARYELAERITGDHHHHFVCVQCGRTDEIAIPAPLEGAITRLIDKLAAAEDYDITGHRLELEGVCSTCRAKR